MIGYTRAGIIMKNEHSLELKLTEEVKEVLKQGYKIMKTYEVLNFSKRIATNFFKNIWQNWVIGS